MASTKFTGGVTKILSTWLDPVNNWTYGPATKTIAKTLTPEAGVKIYPQGSDGGVFIGGTGKAVGYYDDNGGAAYGTRLKPTGGDGTAGWERDYTGPVNVRYFGATGDGLTDDAPAIQATFDFCIAEGQGSIFFKTGNYVLYSSVGVNYIDENVSQDLEIYGTGPDAVVTSAYNAAGADEGIFSFTTSGVNKNLRRISMHDLKINMNAKTGSSIYGKTLAFCQLQNIWTGGFATTNTAPAMFLDNVSQLTISDNVMVHNPNTPGTGGAQIHIKFSEVSTATFRQKCIITNNMFGEQIKDGIIIESISGAGHGGNIISGNIFYTVYNKAIQIINSDYNIINGNSFDEVTSNSISIDSSSYNVITDNVFTDGGSNVIVLDGQATVARDCVGNVIANNSFNQSNNTVNRGIYLSDAETNYTEVFGNTFSGTFTTEKITNVSATNRIANHPTYAQATALSDAITAAAADTTPDVSTTNYINLQAATSYTAFDGGREGQILMVRGAAGAFLVASATLRLSGGADWEAVDTNGTVFLYYSNGSWWEVTRNNMVPQNRGSAVPTTNAHIKGEIVWNTAVAAGGKVGWVCVTAGTPGTWKAFGVVDP